MANPTYYDKWRFTLYTTVVALLFFNPWAYFLLERLVGPTVSKHGCPTLFGFGIHVLLFTFVIRYMMDMKL